MFICSPSIVSKSTDKTVYFRLNNAYWFSCTTCTVNLLLVILFRKNFDLESFVRDKLLFSFIRSTYNEVCKLFFCQGVHFTFAWYAEIPIMHEMFFMEISFWYQQDNWNIELSFWKFNDVFNTQWFNKRVIKIFVRSFDMLFRHHTAKIEYVNEFVLEMSFFCFFVCSFEFGFMAFARLAYLLIAVTVVSVTKLLVTWKSSVVTREAGRLTGFHVEGIFILSFMFLVHD